MHLFGAVYGTLVLHFLAYYTSIFSLYSIVSRFSGRQAGFLAACALGVHPYFLAANGMEYVTGGCIAYCLLTFALLLRSVSAIGSRRWLYCFLAGLSWAGAVYSYPFWLLFTPACLAFYLAAKDADGQVPTRLRESLKDSIYASTVFTAGIVTVTSTMMLIHYRIFGVGWLAFQRSSVDMARFMAHMKESLWASKSFSVTYADWLVFPSLAAALSLILAIPYFRRQLALRPGTGKLLLMYLYFFAVMVYMTIRPGRILQFDYFTSFLLPGAFIVLGVTIFSIPMPLSRPWFWFVLTIASGISLAPLAKPGLYVKPPVLGAVVPTGFLAGALGVRLLRPRSRAALAVMALGLSASAFCLAPAVGGIAWRDPSNWMAATGRVATVVQTVEKRLPYEKYPSFWYDESSPHNLEFQAIMCAFLSIGNSMLGFPEVAGDRHYAPGQVLVILTERPDAFELASKSMERSGRSISLLWAQEIAGAGVGYRVTAIEVH